MNSKWDNMTNRTDVDPTPESGCFSGRLPLLSTDDELRAGIRVTQSEFASLMGCSRQAVCKYVAAGRIIVGPDGRFDPRQAVSRLMKTGDPAKLRIKALEPMANELIVLRSRIVELESAFGQSLRQLEEVRGELALAVESDEFNEAAAHGLIDLLNALQQQILTYWPDLATLPGIGGAEIIIGWLDRAEQFGADGAGEFAEFIPALAIEEGRGEGDETIPTSMDVFDD